MCVIITEFYSENTRNDGYIIMKKAEKSGILVSYAQYLCRDINEKYGLGLNYSESDLKNSEKLKEFINELDENGFYIFQLTRLQEIFCK